MTRKSLTQTCAALLMLLASGCVSSGKYDAAVKSADDAQAELQRVKKADDAQLASLKAKVRDLQTKLDEATSNDAQLHAAMEKLASDADALTAEKGNLALALVESRARLALLRTAHDAALARAQLYQDLATRLSKMIDAGDLSIALRDGRMVLQLPNDVLFDSGQVDIKPRGQAALKQVAAVLKTLDNRRFQVAGHTDNVPISTDRFPSNWELSTTRGVEVTRFLIAQGVPASSLAAGGYGEFDPIASNGDAKGRARNRRIEITLQPNVDELVAVPDAR